MYYFVYILRSIKFPEKIYTGFTADLRRRIEEHNEGKSKYTSNFLPWELVTYVAFSDKLLALKFEKYLKVGSGNAFMKKRLINFPSSN